MNPKQSRFVAEFMVDENATQAAIRAGYSVRSAKEIAHELMGKAGIAAEIAKRRAKVLTKLNITAERVLRERARLAFHDARKLFCDDGSPIPISELDDDTAAAVASLEFEHVTTGRGKNRKTHVQVTKIKTADKSQSLAALEKHLGLYKDEANSEGVLNIHIHM